MPHRTPLAAGGILGLLSILSFASPCLATWPHDPTVNVPVCVHGFNKQGLVACSDAAGGIIMAWIDSRSGVERIYAQRILANGTVAPGWAANGVQLYTSSTVRSEEAPAICPDGVGGAFIGWNEIWNVNDYDIYVQHVAFDGSLAWGASAVGVCTLTDFQDFATMAPDTSGGVYVAWQDHRSGTSYDIYAQHLTSGGSIAPGGWVSQGIVICNAANDQRLPAMTADGSGGFDICWLDARGPDTNALYAQRMTANGAMAGGWVANGILLTQGNYLIDGYKIAPNSLGGGIYVWTDERNGAGNPDVFFTAVSGGATVAGILGGGALLVAPGNQNDLSVAPDGAGGAFVAWADARSGPYDIYAQRVTADGSIALGWPNSSSGLPVCTAVNSQVFPSLVSDGAGGALVAWADQRLSIRYDVYGTHLTADGSVAAGWDAFNNNAVSTAPLDQVVPVAVADGAAGMIVAWLDDRNHDLNGIYDVYAQRIERYGQLGNPEPTIVSVSDVLNDQGGQVKVTWNASYVDAYPGFGVTSYWLWRQVPAAAALAALRQGARMVRADEDPAATPGRAFRTTSLAGAPAFWEYVSSPIANGFPNYSVVAATKADSTSAGTFATTFMVEARGFGNVYWDSAPDSGYSVDNLPPAVPAPFTGAYLTGATHLHWGPNHEKDLAGYRLYKGTTASFNPGPGNLVVAQPDTGFADVGAAGSYYKLSAVDIHGNESLFALLTPSTTLQVDNLVTVLGLAGASPNPVREGTTIRWSLPRAEIVRLDILDTAGRLVLNLASGLQPAGRHETLWDSRDAGGREVPSGIYFIRLRVEGRTLESRIAAIR